MPGRNKVCSCGSGRKFKVCCLPKIKDRPNCQKYNPIHTTRSSWPSGALKRMKYDECTTCEETKKNGSCRLKV